MGKSQSKVGRWSKAEDQYILDNFRTNADYKVIGQKLKRSALSVLLRHKKLNGTLDELKNWEEGEEINEKYEVYDDDSIQQYNKCFKFSFPVASLILERNVLMSAIEAFCSNVDSSSVVNIDVSIS